MPHGEARQRSRAIIAVLSLSFCDRCVPCFGAARMHASTPMTGARSSVDRVLASEARGRWFDPSRARHTLLVEPSSEAVK